MKEKNYFLQLMRGICILAVILIHCKNGLSYESGSYWYNYGVFMRQLLNFPVAVFIFLAGYLTPPLKNYTTWTSKRLKRLIVPYLIWTCIYLLYRIITKSELSVFFIIKSLLCGSAAGHLYYIVVLVQLVIMTPLLEKMLNKNGFYMILFTCTMYYIFFYLLEFVGITLPLRGVLFPAWLLFYYLGLYIRNTNSKYIFRCKYMPIFVAILVSFAEGYFIIKYLKDYGFSVTQVKFSSAIYAVTIINLLLHKINTKIDKDNMGVKIGDVSYGIYYIHFLFINIISDFIQCFDKMPLPIYQLIEAVVVVGTSYFVITMTKKLAPKKAWILGF